jgi:hypothetical protein
MERVVEVAVLTEDLAVARVAGLWEGVKFCRAPVSWGEFRRGSERWKLAEVLLASPGTVWSALAVNSCWRALAGSRPRAALARAVETGRPERLVHSRLRVFYHCTSPLCCVLVNAASLMKLTERTIFRRLTR